jgi:hypothetical protein
VPAFASEYGGMFPAPWRQHNGSDNERDDHHETKLMRCFHVNDQSLLEAQFRVSRHCVLPEPKPATRPRLI